MAINYSPETNEASAVSTEMVSKITDMVAKLLNEDGLAYLLNGEESCYISMFSVKNNKVKLLY